jgi:hypothetical protein
LLESGKYEDLLERIRKGSDYYKTVLWSQVQLLAQHVEDMRSEKRVKGYLNDLGDLDQLISKKLEEVDKIFHLAEGILEGRQNFNFQPIKIARTEARSAMLESIVRTERPAKKAKKKKKVPGEPSTYDISIAMAERGMSIEDIAKERSLVKSTIEGHLAKGVETGRLVISKFMTDEAVEKITGTLREMPDEFFSSEVYSRLKGAYSYGQLRAVMAHTGIKATRKKDLITDGDSPS